METPPLDSPAPENSPPAEVRPAMSPAARLFNIFAAPVEVFDDVKNSPHSTANWLVPVLVAMVVGVIATFVIFSNPVIVQQIREQQAKVFEKQVKDGKMTQAQADQAQQIAERFTGPVMLKIIGSVSVAIVSFIHVFWWALVLWLIGRWCLKSDFHYLKVLEVAGLATMITVLQVIVTTLLVINFGRQTATPSLAFFLDKVDPQNIVHQLMTKANVFEFWAMAVLAAGLAKISGSPFAKPALWIFLYWLAIITLGISVTLLLTHLRPG